MQIRRSLGAWLASAAWAGLLASPVAVQAQSAPVVSRPVVQGLPSAESQRLNAALARIARDPRDYLALVDAGEAANAMGDPEAAVGFYTRADGISPNNPRIKAGMARALVLQGNPTKAIPLFAVAEAGGSALDVTADRGLAYDLVGDPATAQKYYRAALARKDDDEVRRRLGVSLAITGDDAGSEAALMPLLRKQDKPGWRSHAFALAIEGKTKEAVDTVNAILPGVLAQSVTPYLRYMPRLTAAQQAAAANLGKFPRASEIGRDDPAIAAYAPTATRVASADAGLIPQGKPLGGGRARPQIAAAEPLTRSQRRAKEKAAQLARAEATAAARVAPPEPKPMIGNDGELPPLGASTASLAMATPASQPAAVPSAAPSPALTPAPSARTALASRSDVGATVPAAARPALAAVPRTTGAQVRTGSITLPSASLPTAAASTPTSVPTPTPAPSSTPAPATAEPALAASSRSQQPVAAQGFDLGRLAASTPTTPSPTQASAPTPSEPPPDPVSLGQIFADLGAPSRTAAPVAGAVDIRTITPPKPEPEVVKLEAPKADAAKATGKKGAAAKLAAADDDRAPVTVKGQKTGTKLVAEDEDGAGRKGAAKGKAGAKPGIDDEDVVGATKGTKGKTGGKVSTADADAADAKLGPKGKKADAAKAEAKKAPSHPSRIWVQIGVGRDMGAIAYDWRRFAKDNPALFKGRQASTSDMGRTNRILVGPFDTQKAATAFVAQAKKADFDGAFVWNSPAGQVVDPLAGK